MDTGGESLHRGTSVAILEDERRLTTEVELGMLVSRTNIQPGMSRDERV
jgi:hypothetical protein